MMTPPTDPPPLDIVTVAVILLTALAGGEVARIAGPYAVIVAAALVGSWWALSRRPDYSVWQSVGFVALLTCTSVLMTGFASIAAAALLGRVGIEAHAYYLLAPISGALAAVGPDWPDVARWAVRLFKRRAERAMGGDGP